MVKVLYYKNPPNINPLKIAFLVFYDSFLLIHLDGRKHFYFLTLSLVEITPLLTGRKKTKQNTHTNTHNCKNRSESHITTSYNSRAPTNTYIGSFHTKTTHNPFLTSSKYIPNIGRGNG
jgi:hypothetical protein